jgi:uncharacterized beta-barrel protein YwiB (DUF1934 family)
MTVKINIKTTIFQDNSQEVIEGAALGDFFQKETASYLQYEEISDQGSTRTIVKMAGNEALILRSGAVKMRLPFARNQKISCRYKLPFGKFETMTVAKKIDHGYDAETVKGWIDLLYDFSMQGVQSIGTYHLEITFQEEEE